MCRIRPLALLLLALAAFVPRLAAQTYGQWDVACPLSLAPRFSAPHFHGVIYGGQEFLTGWRSIGQATPLPSRNWYEPEGRRNVLSVDERYAWHDAKIRVHCFVERNPYFTTQHADPVAYAGTVRPACSGFPRTALGESDPLSGSQEPYATDVSTPGSGCGDGGGGSGGGDDDQEGGDSDLLPGPVTGDGATRSMCPDNAPTYWDIDCIQIYVEGFGWVDYWCGAVMVCG